MYVFINISVSRGTKRFTILIKRCNVIIYINISLFNKLQHSQTNFAKVRKCLFNRKIPPSPKKICSCENVRFLCIMKNQFCERCTLVG